MIIIHVTYKFPDNSAPLFYEKIKAEKILEKNRNEEGNICFEMYFNAERPNQMFLLEKWKDEAAISQHKLQLHYQHLQELKHAFQIETTIEKISE